MCLSMLDKDALSNCLFLQFDFAILDTRCNGGTVGLHSKVGGLLPRDPCNLRVLAGRAVPKVARRPGTLATLDFSRRLAGSNLI